MSVISSLFCQSYSEEESREDTQVDVIMMYGQSEQQNFKKAKYEAVESRDTPDLTGLTVWPVSGEQTDTFYQVMTVKCP